MITKNFLKISVFTLVILSFSNLISYALENDVATQCKALKLETGIEYVFLSGYVTKVSLSLRPPIDPPISNDRYVIADMVLFSNKSNKEKLIRVSTSPEPAYNLERQPLYFSQGSYYSICAIEYEPYYKLQSSKADPDIRFYRIDDVSYISEITAKN